MALPTILVNSTTGSDSSASGAGPTTALTGTSASYVTATVTLDGSPDLSGVATDGSHVLYLVTSTGVRFFKITAVDNGADTVTVTPNPAGTATGLTWAIGGKRASIGSSSSKLLFDNGGASGDAMPGWIIEMESAHAETIGAEFGWYRAGTSDGPIILRGTSGAATKPVITCNAASRLFRDYASYHVYQDFTVHSTAGKGSFEFAFWASAGNGISWRGIKITSSSGANDWTAGIVPNTGCQILECDISGCDDGIWAGSADASGVIANNHIHGCGDKGIEFTGNTFWGLALNNNLITNNTGDGVYLSSARTDFLASCLLIQGNIFHSNGGDGLEIAHWNSSLACNVIRGNIFSDNGGYGINFSNASATATGINGYGVLVDRNAFGYPANTSGKYLPTGLVSANEIVLTADPYDNAASDDYNLNNTSGGGADLRAVTVTHAA